MIEKGNAWNIFVVKYVVLKGKLQRKKVNIDVGNNSRKVIGL